AAPQSPTWQSTRRRIEAADDWLKRRLDIDEALHTLGHHWKLIAGATALVVLALYGLSGFCTIQANEVGVVRRFGKPIRSDLQPGLHYVLPWPIDTVTVMKPAELRTVEIGFRSAGGSGAQGPRAWSSLHAGGGSRRLPDEAVMITGDGNLIELQCTLRYR